VAEILTLFGDTIVTLMLTGKVGKKKLPPGSYRITLRASIVVGTATATAGG